MYVIGHYDIPSNGDVVLLRLGRNMQNTSWTSSRAKRRCRLYVLNVMK